MTSYLSSYFWIDVKKGRETHLELLLNLVLAALENVHRNVRLAPILQFDRSRSDLRDLIGGQQTQTINQCKVCHPTIVSQRMQRGRLWSAVLKVSGVRKVKDKDNGKGDFLKPET